MNQLHSDNNKILQQLNYYKQATTQYTFNLISEHYENIVCITSLTIKKFNT